MIILSLTETVANWAVSFMEMTGYISITILMALESMIAPVPSEAVMPFAGFMIEQGKFTWTGVVFFSTLGSIIGSLISYYVGVLGGRPIVLKFGKYLLLDKHHLELTEKFFEKKGDATIFICRFIPVVRHLISIPAGIARMNIFKFSIYTIIGAAIWNTFLTYMGYLLRQNWEALLNSKWKHLMDFFFVGMIVLVFGYFAYKLIQDKKKRATVNSQQ